VISVNETVGNIVTVKRPITTNQVGGSAFIEGIVKAKITKTFEDSEQGQRFIGELIENEDIKKSLLAGKTSFRPKHYQQYGEEMYQSALSAYKAYDPKKVYFGEKEII